MAVDKKISQLASGAPAQAGDEYVVARSGANFKLTLTNIAASMPPIGATTPNTGAFTTLSASSGETISGGNLTFSSTAQRITGDMSNATLSNRLAFQTSTTNGNTTISALPNGTAVGAACRLHNSSDPANSSRVAMGVDSTITYLESAISGTGTYLPMTFYTNGSERVRIDTSGSVGIGGTAGAANKLEISGILPTSGAVTRSFAGTGTIPSGTTTAAINYSSAFTTAAASFTLTDMVHFNATQPTLGAGSAVTNIYGFAAQSSLALATNTYGFYGNIASGTNRYNVYMAGTADNYFAGNVGIGTASPTSKLGVSSSGNFADILMKTASVTQGIWANESGGVGVVGTVTNHPLALYTNNGERVRIDTSGRVGIGLTNPTVSLQVANTSGNVVVFSNTTAGERLHFYTRNATGTSRVESQNSDLEVYTFDANALKLGTSNTARMTIDTSGNVGIGGTADATDKVTVAGNLPVSSTISISFANRGVITSATTGAARGFQSYPSTAAASFALNDLTHFWAGQNTLGAGSSVTNQYGFYVHNSVTGATNNYGFHSNIASGSNRWNFYAAGTAQNYFAGNTGVGVAGGINGARLSVSSGTANATTYKVFATQGGSTVQYQQQKTTSVSTSATIILTPGDGPFAGLALVFGHDGSGNRFIDLVMFSVGTGTVNVINSLTASGTPAARTYSQGSSAYQLAMASGTYTVEVMIIGMGS
jgi:hypothetical protein